jgi:2-polyprenyl-3-methyl-5-hydroxy-6-metoxy-1,4-benzoquinol methylase
VEQQKVYDACPVCAGQMLNVHLVVKDHMITKEDFTIVKCQSCGFHFTNPIPSEETIGAYYKSVDYISHSSSNAGLINKVYNAVRKITLKRKVNLVQRLSRGKQLLDIGAGTGHFLNQCKTAGFQLQGLEPDEDARKFALSNFGLTLEPIEKLTDIPAASKDVITMWHVLEHVYHLKRDIAEISRILKPDGILIIAVPNMNSWDAQQYGSNWAAYDVPRHLYHFQPQTIQKLFSEFSMECVEMLPMKFDAFYVSMLSEKYQSGNFVKGILNGWKSNRNGKKEGFSSQVYVFRKQNAK